jgi:hypothetical protein
MAPDLTQPSLLLCRSVKLNQTRHGVDLAAGFSKIHVLLFLDRALLSKCRQFRHSQVLRIFFN